MKTRIKNPKIPYEKIAFVASQTLEARLAMEALVSHYGQTQAEDADIVVALGGDGLMLQTLHHFLQHKKPIFGMNLGSVGFLMNEFAKDDLKERLYHAEASIIHPLLMKTIDLDGNHYESRAINEVSVFRQSHQAAKMKISIDHKVRLQELMADGLLVATPAGSTAYNFSAHGPILPLESPLMALTPISAFRPRHWRGALLSDKAHIKIDIFEARKRPVSAVADHLEIKEIQTVSILMDHATELTLLHDPGHSLHERIVREQFSAF